MGSEIFAKRLRELREEKGLGVRELAAKLNMSHVAISYYENAKRVPDLLVAKKFAEFFDTTCDYLRLINGILPVKLVIIVDM